MCRSGLIAKQQNGFNKLAFLTLENNLIFLVIFFSAPMICEMLLTPSLVGNKYLPRENKIMPWKKLNDRCEAFGFLV